MWNVGSLLSFLVLIFNMNTFASECIQQDFDEAIVCEKNFRAKSFEDIGRYKTDVSLNKKNLVIAFDILADQSLEVHTPCTVRFHRDFHISTTGDLCIDARDGIRFQRDKNISANSIELFSKKIITIQRGSTVNVDKLSMISNGYNLDSRVHIRNTSIISARELKLFGSKMATLGHSSNYNISGNVDINSADGESAIYRNTYISSPSISINSNSLVTFGRDLDLNSSSIDSSAPECNLNNNILSSSFVQGCFDPSRPIAKIRKTEKFINKDESLQFKLDRSHVPNGVSEYIFYVNDIEVQRGSEFILNHTFSNAGVFYIRGVVVDHNGYRSSKKRKIEVSSNLIADYDALFTYSFEEDNLNLIFHQNLPYSEYKSAAFKILKNQEVIKEIPLSEFYHRKELPVTDLEYGDYIIELNILDIFDRVITFQREVNYQSEASVIDLQPTLDIKFLYSENKTVFLDLRGSFDPALRLEGVFVEWGDGTTSTFDDQELFGFKHSYENNGDYEVKISVFKEGTFDITGQEIRTVNIGSHDLEYYPPILDYYIFEEEFAGHVSWNIYFTEAPSSEVESVLIDYGDGSSANITGKSIDTHFYEPGVYHPKITVTDLNGIQTTKQQEVVIVEAGPPLISELFCSSFGLRVECELVALDKQRQLSELHVDWGDGNTQVIALENSEWSWSDLEHDYAFEGVYNIEFSVGTIREEGASKVETISLGSSNNDDVYADFHCYSDIPGQISCDASNSYYNNGFISNYIYSINGQEYSSGSSYAQFSLPEYEGQHIQVDLTIMTNDGKEVSISSFVYVNEPQAPVADFSCISNRPRTVECSNHSFDDTGIQQRTWTLSTGETFVTDSFTHLLNINEDISVELTVVDYEGLSSSLTRQISVIRDQPPIVDFSCESYEVNTINCMNNSSDDMPGVAYTWELLGASYQQEDISSLNLGRGGSVDVKLTSTDSFGQSTSLVESYDVISNILPIASFDCSQTIHSKIECQSTSVDNDGSISSIKFIANGTIYEGEYVLIDLVNDNPIDVTLEVVDNSGGVSTVTNQVVVNKAPVPLFSCSQQNQSNLVTCNAGESQDEDLESLNYSWVLNEVIYSGQNFQVELPYGTHLVTLTVSDTLGSQSTLEKDITLYNYNNAPEPMFAHYFEIGNIGMFNGSLSLNGDREVVLYTWYVDGQEIQSSSDFVFQYTFSDNNEHTVKLVVKDSLDRVAEYEEVVMPYDPQVPAPDELLNSEQFLGIDSDSNGMRDDLQRFWVVITLNNVEYKRYLGKIIKNLQSMLVNKDDYNLSRTLIEENKSLYRCIYKIDDPDIYTNIIDKHIHTMHYGSKERLEFYDTVESIYEEYYEDEVFDCEGVTL